MTTINQVAGPFRGGTLRFETRFYDIDGVETQPAGAVVNLVYMNATNQIVTTQLTMNPPPTVGAKWYVDFDTRSVGPGTVSWSIHSTTLDGNIPFAVEDGNFQILANAANLPTF